jgi:predicted transcriptional regulator
MITADVSEFIVQRLSSVAELEALLLLWRNPGKDWSVAKLARRLYITEVDVSDVLRKLTAQHLVEERNGFYRYWQSSASLVNNVERLAELYCTHLVAITELMHSKSNA